MAAEDNPLISVIIPTFNRAGLIKKTVESALAQSYKNKEILVVDDASTDNTASVLKDVSDPRVKYCRLDQNSGPSTARNTGVELAEGEFITFLDSDDEWNTRKLELQLASVSQQEDPGNVVCYTQAIVAHEGGTRLLPTRGKSKDEPVGDYVLCGNHGLIHTSSLMLARTLAAANPFPVDQKNFEDWDLFLRLEEKGVHWLYLDEPLITWNDDSREGRLTLSKHDGSAWLDSHRRYLSKKAQQAFTLKGIVLPLIRARKRKLYTLKSLVWALPGSDMPFGRALKLAVKIFIPPDFVERLKMLSPTRSPR